MTQQKHSPKIDWGFYISTPRIVRTQFKHLTHVEKWLYVCLKDLCGDTATCYRTLRVLAEETDLSIGTLSTGIRHLHDAGLIHAEKKRRSNNATGKEVWHITIVDIWQENAKVHPTVKCSPPEQKRSSHEQYDGNVQDMNNNVQQMNDTSSKRSGDEQKCSNFDDRSNNNKAIPITEERTIEEESNSDDPANNTIVPPIVGTSPSDFPSEQEPDLEDDDLDPTEKMPTVRIAPTAPDSDATTQQQGDDHVDLPSEHSGRDRLHTAAGVAGDLAANENRRLASSRAGRSVEATQQAQKAPIERETKAAQQNHSACTTSVGAVVGVGDVSPSATISGDASPSLQAHTAPTRGKASAKTAPKWNVEAMVVLAEKLRDKPFSEAARPKETKKAAQLFKRKPDMTQEEFEAAWRNWDTEWWRTTNGPFTLTDLAATPKDKSEMRLILALDKLAVQHKARMSGGHEMSETKAAILASGLPDYTYVSRESVVYRPLRRIPSNGKTVSV